MKPIGQWLAEYSESHTHPTNVLIHKICVPAIMFSVLGLLWPITVPQLAINMAIVVTGIVLVYYALLSLSLFTGMLLLAGGMLGLLWWLDQHSATAILPLSITIFTLAWILQFIGHKIEGKKPSFFQDLLFLLIGPIWTLEFMYRKMGIKF